MGDAAICTTWHVTFGTYGARLHGDVRPTVDRRDNRPGQPFVGRDPGRAAAQRRQMRSAAVQLTYQYRLLIEARMPDICIRGHWQFRTCAAGPDHVHLLCDAPRSVHGKQVRALVKRWLSQLLNERDPQHQHRQWWADGGSSKPVKDATYLNNAHAYITRQRTTPD